MSERVTLGEHFKRLFNFAGREDRASFWPYAAVAFILTNVAGMFIFVPMMAQTIRAMQEFAAQNPERATVTSGPGQYSISVRGNHPEFIPAETIALFLAVTFGCAIVLYAAAVVRRLRDSHKSGYWGLMPLPFIAYSSITMPSLFSSIGSAPDFNVLLFFSVFLSNLLYMAALIWLIILLAKPSASSPRPSSP